MPRKTTTKRVADESAGNAQEEPDPPKKKSTFSYKKFLERSGPKNPGSKEIPVGTDNCLVGLSFVFTGELDSLSREQAQDIAKRYGGRVVGQPSSKTSFVIVGDDAGPSKMQKVATLGLKTLTEDGFLDLIRSSSLANGATESTKAVKTETKISPAIAIARTAVTKVKAGMEIADSKGKSVVKSTETKASTDPNDLWTVKYAPKSYSDLIGNRTVVEKLVSWLHAWDRNYALGFEKKTCGEFAFKAALISGPPGIGKTTAAYLVAKTEGYESLEFNASDSRNKSSIDAVVRDATLNYGIREFFGPQNAKKKKTLIIMDEVDGMSAGDRGGSAELIQVIKKSKVPMICICNDRLANSVKSLSNYCLDLRFRRPTSQQVEGAMKVIAAKEGLELKPNVIGELVQSTSGDIRQIINVLSTFKLKNNVLDYDQVKQIGMLWNKDAVLSSFDVCAKLLGPAAQSLDFRKKYEMFFYDYGLIPLMIEENYLTIEPLLAKHVSGGDQKRLAFENLRCAQMASEYISLGDCAQAVSDRTQNWSLLPTIAMLSAVGPSFFSHGNSHARHSFASWFGQFSKTKKSQRLLREVQQSMRLRISGGTSKDVRLDYLDVVGRRLLSPFSSTGTVALTNIKDTISLMDDYYLDLDSFEAITDNLLVYGEKSVNGLKQYLHGGKAINFNDISAAGKKIFRKEYKNLSHPTLVPEVQVRTSGKGAPKVMTFKDTEAESVSDKMEDDADESILEAEMMV